MKQKFNFDHTFVISHRSEINKILQNPTLVQNINDERVSDFALFVIQTIAITLNAVALINNQKRLDSVSKRIAHLNTLKDIVNNVAELAETDNESFKEVVDFIHYDIIECVLHLKVCDAIKLPSDRKVIEMHDRLSSLKKEYSTQLTDSDFERLFFNKETETTVRFVSSYRRLERFCFLNWIHLNLDDSPEPGLLQNEEIILSLYNRFKIYSWFALLEDLCNQKDNDDSISLLPIFDLIINDYTGITCEEYRRLVQKMLMVFWEVLNNFKKNYNPNLEIDDRPNICGFIFPKALSYDEYRINFAADFVVENGLIDSEKVELFKRIMREEETPLPLDFQLGPYKNGKQNKTGGKGALYWLIRYVKEPYNLEGKSASYDSIASKFRFNGMEIDYKKLSDTGKGSNMKEDVIAYMKNKEKDAKIYDGLLK